MKDAGYYKDKSGDTWLKMGDYGIVVASRYITHPLDRSSAVWVWGDAVNLWGPMELTESLRVPKIKP
jgi:hypothetical protein